MAQEMGEINSKGTYHFTWEREKSRLENQKVSAIPFGKF